AKKKQKKILKKQTSKSTGKSGKGLEQPQIMQEKEKRIIEKVRELAEPICEVEQIELVFVQYQREPGGRTLRVYIDKPGGIGLNDCVHISRQLSDVLDIYLDNENPYNLEVSSPGTDRPLGRLQDFERFKGNMAKIKSARAIDGQKNFKGILLGVLDKNIKLQAHDNKNVEIPFLDIVKARLVNYNGETSCS
ncbi:MAG: ribosome maturation factor RimP, partial [Desulfobacterales bacterium]